MNTRVLIFFIILLFPVMLPQSYACECFGTKDYTPIVDDSELVFIGTVKDIVANGENPTVFVTFDVHSIAKGELTENQITTSTPLSDCSVDYKIGTTYVVVIHDENSFSTDRCSTKSLETMDYFEVIPDSLLLAMTEPEVPESDDLIVHDSGRVINQDSCNRSALSQWQPTVEGMEKTAKFLDICIQRGFMTSEIIEIGKNANGYSTLRTDAAYEFSNYDVKKTIELLQDPCFSYKGYDFDCGVVDVDMTNGFGGILVILVIIIPSSIVIVGFLVWRKRK